VTAVLLALLTALTYGLANYLGPVVARRHPLGGVLLVGQVAALTGAAALLAVRGGAVPDRTSLLLGLLAGVANGVSLAGLYAAAAVVPISVLAPIGATGGVVPVVVALVRGERPDLLQLVGIPLAVVGVVLAAARPGAEHDAEEVAARRPAGLALTVLAALAFGAFLTLFAEASRGGQAWAVFSSRVSLVACTAGVLLVRRVPVGFPRADVPLVALPGLLLLTGTVAYGEATAHGLVSVVAVLATLSPVVTVGLAVVLLGERLAPWQRIGVAAALSGVVLLAAG
jgi:drug/metabolite transporter (DMT)-like permease